MRLARQPSERVLMRRRQLRLRLLRLLMNGTLVRLIRELAVSILRSRRRSELSLLI